MFRVKKKLIIFIIVLSVLNSIDLKETKNDIINNFKIKFNTTINNIAKPVEAKVKKENIIQINNIPKYSGKPYIIINNNKPMFTSKQLSIKKSYEKYSKYDKFGRCQFAIANIGKDIMPTTKRGNISSVIPSGWKNAKYSFIDGKYLYNRCHLIGYQLTGENANRYNLITGTRYLNVEGMLPFENQVADYVKETNKHVLYRITPIYTGTCLVASGVQMEAKSVEDKGKNICFNVYIYNVQPGIQIDYKTGNSWRIDKNGKQIKGKYIINTSSKKIHTHNCKGVKNIYPKNKKNYTGCELPHAVKACGFC